eukprot:1138699-Pelagomonas_calceolata.AAC.4
MEPSLATPQGTMRVTESILARSKGKRENYASGSHLKRCVKEGPTLTATRAQTRPDQLQSRRGIAVGLTSRQDVVS